MTSKTKTSDRRKLSPRAQVRQAFDAKGADAALAVGKRLKLSEPTAKRYVQFFAANGGKKKSAKKA